LEKEEEMKTWLAQDIAEVGFHHDYVCIFFGRKPRMSKEGYWYQGENRIRNVVDARSFPKLKSGEIRKMQIVK